MSQISQEEYDYQITLYKNQVESDLRWITLCNQSIQIQQRGIKQAKERIELVRKAMRQFKKDYTVGEPAKEDDTFLWLEELARKHENEND